MNIREEYKKETGYDAFYKDDKGYIHSDFYTDWLESKIFELQKVKNNDFLHSFSVFSASKVEEAYKDGWNDREIGTDTFNINNYR